MEHVLVFLVLYHCRYRLQVATLSTFVSLVVLWLRLVLCQFQHLQGLVELLLLYQYQGLQVQVVQLITLGREYLIHCNSLIILIIKRSMLVYA